MTADLLRRAASLLRARAEAATPGPWEFRPRRGFQSTRENPATIGFTDTAGYFVMLREGTWGSEGDMTYIAALHPAVALALADWLEAEIPAATFRERQRDEQEATRIRSEPFPVYYDRTTAAAMALAAIYLNEPTR